MSAGDDFFDQAALQEFLYMGLCIILQREDHLHIWATSSNLFICNPILGLKSNMVGCIRMVVCISIISMAVASHVALT